MLNISKLYCGLAGQSDDLRYSSDDLSGPVVVYNCTRRCNLNCLHCYSASGRNRRNNELSTSQAKRLLSQLADANCPVVLFSGGEPMLRQDLFELLEEAQRLKLRAVISTNGTLIDSDKAKRLVDVGVSYVGVSIDGNEKFHDEFRQSKGSFKAALAGIENCRKAGLKTGLRFTITKQNARQLTFVFELAASEGIRRICFYHLIRSGRAKHLNEHIPELAQTRHVVDTIIEKTDDLAEKALINEVLTVGNHADGPYLLVRIKNENKPIFEEAKQLLFANGGNRTGEKIACVSSDGSVHPDQFWQNHSLGNVTTKSFEEIWYNSNEPVLNKLRNKSKFADERCQKCKWFDLCKGNFRFLAADSADKNWLNEPACYLTDEEIGSIVL